MLQLGVLGVHPDFNPRSREGSDQLSKSQADSIVISIHAPAKGATAVSNTLTKVCLVDFNPRSREGSDG